MLQTIKAKAMKKRENGEGGFTLIELMVVVLIIAILLAIAIPTFLGAQNKAKDRAAQSGLRNTLTNAKTVYADTQNYSGATDLILAPYETGMTFNAAGTSSGPKVISVLVAAGTPEVFIAAAKSDAGECFYIKDDLSGAGVQYAKATTSPCVATATPVTPGWGAKW